MKKILLLVFVFLTVCADSQTATVERPRILGIDHVSFYTTDPAGVKALYNGTLGLAFAEPVEAGGLVRYMVGRQWVGYSAAPDPKATDRMDHVAFTTDNIAALRKYLIAKGVKVPAVEGHGDHSLSFRWLIRKAIALSLSSAARANRPLRPPIPQFHAT